MSNVLIGMMIDLLIVSNIKMFALLCQSIWHVNVNWASNTNNMRTHIILINSFSTVIGIQHQNEPFYRFYIWSCRDINRNIIYVHWHRILQVFGFCNLGCGSIMASGDIVLVYAFCSHYVLLGRISRCVYGTHNYIRLYNYLYFHLS